MRIALLAVGILCVLIGLEFLLVDKIVLHEFVMKPPDAVRQTDDYPETGGRVIDLPDSGGYVLLAIGVVCLMYFVAIRRQKER